MKTYVNKDFSVIKPFTLQEIEQYCRKFNEMRYDFEAVLKIEKIFRKFGFSTVSETVTGFVMERIIPELNVRLEIVVGRDQLNPRAGYFHMEGSTLDQCKYIDVKEFFASV